MSQVPPANDVVAERALVVTVAFDPGYLPDVMHVVQLGDFYQPELREVMSAICALNESQLAIEPATIEAWLYDHGRMGHAGGPEALGNLLDASPTTTDPLALAQRIAYLSAVRRVDLSARRIATEARGPIEDHGMWLVNATEAVREAADVHRLVGRDTTATSREVVIEVHQELMERERKRKAGEESAPGLSTGFGFLDYRMGRLAKGGVTILGAESGVGKTGFALAIACNVAKKGHGVGYVTLELPNAELGERMLVSFSGVDSDAVFHGHFELDDHRQLAAAISDIATLPMVFDDAAEHTSATLRAFVRRAEHRMKVPLELLVVDYLQLVKGNTRPGANDNEIIAEASRSILKLAKDLGISVLALAQFNRDRKYRKSGEPPVITDLYGSGQIEKDAHAIVLLHVTSEKGVEPASVIATVQKGRAGSHLGPVELMYRKRTATWYEVDDQYDGRSYRV